MASIKNTSSAMCVHLILCLILLSINCATEPVDGSIYPVTEKSVQCKRTGPEKSWICDAAGVLSKEEADAIDAVLMAVNANASCVCNCSKNGTSESDTGYVLAVVVTLETEDFSNDNETSYLEQFSDTVRRSWFDNRVCDDSGLILAYFNKSKIYISLGDALDILLPDQALPFIYEAIQPSLDTGDLSQALRTTILELSSAINEAINEALNSTNKPPPNNLVWGILGVITVSSILLFHYWIKY